MEQNPHSIAPANQDDYPDLEEVWSLPWSEQQRLASYNNSSVYQSPYGSAPAQDVTHQNTVPTGTYGPPYANYALQQNPYPSSVDIPSEMDVDDYEDYQEASGAIDPYAPNAMDYDEEISDADSDTKAFRAEQAKKEEQRRLFVQQHTRRMSVDEDEEDEEEDEDEEDYGSDDDLRQLSGMGRGRGRGRGRGAVQLRGRGRGKGVKDRGKTMKRRGGLRGPRKAAELTGDIKYRLGQATQAYIEQRYDDANRLTGEIIQINGEVYEAWTLMASIMQEVGEMEHSLTALTAAAHLRPKEVSTWIRAAEFALYELADTGTKHHGTIRYLYSAATRNKPMDPYPRREKAAFLFEIEKWGSATTEYRQILKLQPHDLEIIRQLAVLASREGHKEPSRSKDLRITIKLYKDALNFYKDPENLGDLSVDWWSEVNVFVELHGLLGDHAGGIRELKSFSRWIAGREDETFWEDVTYDDREWDAGDARRLQIEGYIAGQHDEASYGNGLPLELRVMLGTYRLALGHFEEGMNHLMWLDPNDETGHGIILDYSDLYLVAAHALLDAEHAQEALQFFQPLLDNNEKVDAALHSDMGKCYRLLKMNKEAENSLLAAVQLDEKHVAALRQLAELYEELNEQDQAMFYLNQVINLTRRRYKPYRPRQKKASNINKPEEEQEEEAEGEDTGTFMPPDLGRKSYYKPKRLADPAARAREDDEREQKLRQQYKELQEHQQGMEAGDEKATATWLAAAEDLLADFRACKALFPWDKFLGFLGYHGDSKYAAEQNITGLDPELEAMAERLTQSLMGNSVKEKTKMAIVDKPMDYRGIDFSVWLDMFLNCALCFVRTNRQEDAYDICEAAKDCIVWYHQKEETFLIHTTWAVCALLTNDEETCVSTGRFFMKDHQFSTDAYRMFAMLNRVCQSPTSWYNAGPTQKYVLRQIKTMDWVLVQDEETRRKFFSDRGSYSVMLPNGESLVNDDMDIALLMLYGNILYAGTSYSYALNYFYRALTLDPTNPIIHLTIGLTYIHYALKRQSENRQYLIMQGLTFLFKYYDVRVTSPHVEERIEAEYNVGRAYHLLGLTHLAIEYYERVLGKYGQERLERDAAYNLANLYFTAGNVDEARRVTEEWLVI